MRCSCRQRFLAFAVELLRHESRARDPQQARKVKSSWLIGTVYPEQLQETRPTEREHGSPGVADFLYPMRPHKGTFSRLTSHIGGPVPSSDKEGMIQGAAEFQPAVFRSILIQFCTAAVFGRDELGTATT